MSEIKVNSIKGVAASTAALTINNTDGTCTANITSLNGGQFGNRNKVINGAALVTQRGTISDHGTSGKYTAVDRFCTKIGSSFNFDITSSQSTDAPAGFQNSLKLSPDSTQTPTSSANGAIQTKLEGQDLQDFAFGTSSAKPMTLSFYAKSGSAGAGTYSIEMQYVSSSGSLYHQTRAFTITSSFQRFTFTFEANGDSTSVAMKNDNSDTLRIVWHLASGQDDKTSAITTWTNTGAMKTITGMDNFMSSTSNEFYITGVQLEVGSVATDFEHRSFAQELALCQRYFCAYGSTVDNIQNGDRLGCGISTGSNTAIVTIPTGSKLRAFPTVAFSSGITINDAAGGPDVSSVSRSISYNGHAQIQFVTNPSSLTSGNAAHIRFESTSYLHLSAEL